MISSVLDFISFGPNRLCNDNILNLCSDVTQFEFWLDYCLSWLISGCGLQGHDTVWRCRRIPIFWMAMLPHLHCCENLNSCVLTSVFKVFHGLCKCSDSMFKEIMTTFQCLLTYHSHSSFHLIWHYINITYTVGKHCWFKNQLYPLVRDQFSYPIAYFNLCMLLHKHLWKTVL